MFIEKDGWILVDNFGQQIEVGETRQDFRGELSIIEGGTPPHKPGSTGRVYIKEGREYYPSVFDLLWYNEAADIA